MTPKLTDRLARLEAAQAADTAAVPIPLEIAGAYLHAIAIAIGGYPRAPEPAPSYRQDTLSDGLARGLGYRDRDDMEAGLEADRDEWDARARAAVEVLTARYVKDRNSERTGPGTNPAFQFFVGVLNEISGATSSNKAPGVPHHWPSVQPQLDRSAKSIRRVLGYLGITSEEQIAEACS